MHDRLERLRRKLAAADNPEDRADLAAAIAAREEKLGSVAPAPAGDTISASRRRARRGGPPQPRRPAHDD
jgi:hypothetical protein